MPGSAAVIGHGGLGTVLRALAHGVPQLLLPLGRDQAFNADQVERVSAPTSPTGPLPRRSNTPRTDGDGPRTPGAHRHCVGAARRVVKPGSVRSREAIRRTGLDDRRCALC